MFTREAATLGLQEVAWNAGLGPGDSDISSPGFGYRLFRIVLAIYGFVLGALVGLVALSWLISWLERGRLRLFAWWCIPLGVVVTIWQLWVAYH